MSSPRVAEATRPEGRRLPVRPIAVAAGVAAAVLGIAVLLFDALAEPERVEDLTVTNPTDFAVEVRVGSGDGSWLGLGTVQPGGEQLFEGVTDQGEVWVFEFRYGDEPLTTVEVPRAELSERDWTLSVPESVAESLRERGEAPTPGAGG